MTMEDGLFNAFKHLGFDKNARPAAMVTKMLREAQRQMLIDLMRSLEDALRKLDNGSPTTDHVENEAESLDPYTILGVSPIDDYDTVKKAFWRMQHEAHEDKGGTHADSIRVNAAYEAIKIFKGWK